MQDQGGERSSHPAILHSRPPINSSSEQLRQLSVHSKRYFEPLSQDREVPRTSTKTAIYGNISAEDPNGPVRVRSHGQYMSISRANIGVGVWFALSAVPRVPRLKYLSLLAALVVY